jgi:hypothetical protein
VRPAASLVGEVSPSFSNSLSYGKITRKLVVLAVAVYTKYTEYKHKREQNQKVTNLSKAILQQSRALPV